MISSGFFVAIPRLGRLHYVRFTISMDGSECGGGLGTSGPGYSLHPSGETDFLMTADRRSHIG